MRAEQYLYHILQDVASELDLSWTNKISLGPPREEKHGDLATNLAMVCAKQAGKNPRKLAEEIKSRVNHKADQLEHLEIAGPGFLNFFFRPGFWQQVIQDIQQQQKMFGSSSYGGKKSVLLEFVSANPTGPLHVGHGRGAAVGDTLARILRFTGFEVTTEYYLNDAGRQIDLLGRSIWTRYSQICGQDMTLPEECYQGGYIRDLAAELKEVYGQALLDKSEDQAIEICRQKGLSSILASIKEDLLEFEVEHQSWFSEKSLLENGIVDKTLNHLRRSGIAYEQDGALWFSSSRFGDDKDRVLRKSNGELTYFASDIAYHANKFFRGYDLLIDIWGADHHGYVPRMKGAITALEHSPEELKVLLIQLVNLIRQGNYVSMSTRSGEFETLSNVCQEVGKDAARFIFLSRRCDSPLDFDLDLLKQKTMENPVYYVQYAHARICSVFGKAREKGIVRKDDHSCLNLLNTDQDLELLKLLDRFPDTLQGAAETLNPHFLSFYLQDLAGLLHRYYNKHQIINLEDDQLTQARLHLIDSVAQVLGNGLQLLGVSAPESM